VERLERRDTPAASPFTVAVLPDTQFYSQTYPETFLAQTRWIAENRAARSIAFVSHLGDIVQSNARGTNRNLVEWQRADAAIDLLDGDLAANPDGLVPYSVALGNHDTDVMWSKPGVATRYDEYFGASRYAARSWYVENSGLTGNHAQVFTAGGYRFLHLTLQFEPLDSDLAWARGIMARHPGLPTILSTHSYIQPSSAGRFAVVQGQSGTTDDPANSGEQVFQKLVRPSPQIFLVMNGHFGGEFHQVSANAFGQPVLELGADYQSRTNGGDGWLRLLEIDTTAGEVRVQTYSPTLNQYERDADSEFTLGCDFRGRYGEPLPAGHAVSVFQDGRTAGAAIYTGTVDTQLRQAAPTTASGTATTTLLVDAASPLATDTSQVLLRFDGLVGAATGQVPAGATVLSARLVVDTTNPGAGGALHRMVQPWSESATWNSLTRGIQADGREAARTGTAQAGFIQRTPLVAAGATEIDVTADVRHWVAGGANYGWAILPWGGGTDGWAFSPSEATAIDLRPKLMIEWLPTGATVSTFQQGASGYADAADTVLSQRSPHGNFSTAGGLRAEATAGRVSQALVKFGSLFGTATGQIPPGATIQSARLRFTTLGAAGPAARLFRLLQPFGTGTTWASGYGGNGVQPYGLEARAAADRVVSPATAGTHAVDVTTSLRDWAAGGVNHGWLLESAGIGAWSLASSEYTVAAARLRLEVTWTPAASSLASAPISVAPTASARLPFGIETLWAAVAWSDSPSTPRSFRSGSVR
jgi:hypothetical protein